MYSFGALVFLHNDFLRIMTTIFYDVPRESHCPCGLATNEAKMINCLQLLLHLDSELRKMHNTMFLWFKGPQNTRMNHKPGETFHLYFLSGLYLYFQSVFV